MQNKTVSKPYSNNRESDDKKGNDRNYLKVLMIEDNPEDIFLLKEILEESFSRKFKINSTETLQEGLKQISENKFDVILLDLGLPDSTGFETFLQTKKFAENIPIIILTGLSNEELAANAVRNGAQDYLLKNEIDAKILSKAIYYAIERKKSEIEHAIISKQLQLALDASNMGWWYYNPITNISTYDEQYKKLFKVSDSQKPNDEILKLIHPDDLPSVWKKVEQSLDPIDPKPYSTEYRIFRGDKIRWIEAYGLATFEGEGNKKHAISLVGTVKDITDRKKAQEVAIRWEKVFKNAKFGLAMVDASDNRFLDVNHTYAHQRGYKIDELIGKEVVDVHPPENREKIKNLFPKIDKAGHIVFEAINSRKDGTTFPVLMEVTVLKDEQGLPKSRVAYALDITQQKEAESDLRESEEKFRELFDNANDMISLNEIKENGLPGKFIEVNKIGTERLGYSREEFLNMSPEDIIAPSSKHEILQNASKLQEKGYAQYEIIHIAKNKKKIPVEVNNHIFELNGETVALAISRDISERLKAESVIKESENKYRVLFEKSSSYLILISTNGDLIDVNESAISFSGLSKEELIGKNFTDLSITPKSEISKHKENISKVLKGEKIKPYESTLIGNNGETHYIMVSLNPLTKNNEIASLHVICNDITDLKLAEKEIKNSLNEKELLLQEIHHRVKNNMQIISSLLNLQSYSVTEEETKDILKDSQGRIKAMSTVHEKLYQSTDLSHVNFKEYIEKLVHDLFYSYEVEKESIELNIDIDNIELNMETIIPLGLIINELVTNSLKFAFPDDKGCIDIVLITNGDKYTLIISDDGIGFNKKIKIDKMKSLGLQLVNSLVNQVDGSIDIDYSKGAKFIIKFEEVEYKGRI